jgi:flagellar basal body-associated protein FliL
MKITGEGRSPVLTIIYRILLILLMFIALFLLGGTLYALVFHKGQNDTKSAGSGSGAAGEEQVFTGIGRLRVSAAGSGPPTVVVNITFPYSAADKPFSEELVSRIKDFRTIASDYFRSFSAADLGSADEAALKEELLNRYNGILRLGKIEILYFNDFLIIE